MAKMVGLSRNIKLSWLNKTFEFIKAGYKDEELKDQINQYLGFEIASSTNIRKTREILLRILYYENPVSEKIRLKGLELLEKYPDNRTVVYWMLMLSTYPVFKDLTFLIGKLSEFQDDFTLAQAKKKMYDEWGERSAIFHSTDKIFATMKALDTLESSNGRYKVIRHEVKQTEIINYMIYTMMSIEDNSYCSMTSLNSIPCLFPFKYKITREQILMEKCFTLSSFGNEVTVSLNSK